MKNPLDPLGQNPEFDQIAWRAEQRDSNLDMAKALRGPQSLRPWMISRIWRYFSWEHWNPGRINNIGKDAGSLKGLFTNSKFFCMDGLVWIEFGEQQRVVSAQFLRKLADAADYVDSTKSETWGT